MFDVHSSQANADSHAAPEAKMTAEVAERRRMNGLSGQSFRTNSVLVEMVYLNQWVRFDITGMEAAFLTWAQLAERYFAPAATAIGITRAPGTDASSSETPVAQE